MRPEELEYLYRLEETFWWFAGMRRITDAVLERRFKLHTGLKILDAGCGTGFNIIHTSQKWSGNAVFGLDISADAIAWTHKRGVDCLCQASVTAIPFPAATFDLVSSFEVISQGTHPPVEKGLREMQRVLRPGGLLLVRVPAFRWMRSSHDMDVDTNRRFTRRELEREVRTAGMKLEWISYANCFLFPTAIVRRLLKGMGIGGGSDVRPLPGFIDAALRGILSLEAFVFRAGLRLPFGLSIVCLARRPES
jgi:SAM-dependent methyltransferase